MIESKRESFVFVGEEEQNAVYQFIEKGSFSLYAIDGEGNTVKVYTEGKDYSVNYEKGTVKRTPNSTIPDFRKNVLYGAENFDQGDFPGYGNENYTLYADYKTNESRDVIRGRERGCLIPKTVEKLKSNGKIRLAIFGDSISTGAEASLGNSYFDKTKTYLEEKYGGEVELVNLSVGGDSTVEGLKRINYLDTNFDFVIIAFGMNDQNKFENIRNSVPAVWYEYNIGQFIDVFQSKGAEIIVLSPAIPNPKWAHSSEFLGEYVCALKRVTLDRGVAFVNVTEKFRDIIAKGKTYESLLRNNINHPNDFGHILYFESIREIL